MIFGVTWTFLIGYIWHTYWMEGLILILCGIGLQAVTIWSKRK